MPADKGSISPQAAAELMASKCIAWSRLCVRCAHVLALCLQARDAATATAEPEDNADTLPEVEEPEDNEFADADP